MMPNVTRGERMAGLMTYLVGEGRANEHTEPHLVAGDSAIMAWHDDAELDRDAALQIAKALDHPRKAFGVEVAKGSVWHCSLSLRAEEGQLTDEKWGAIARDFVGEMGFDGSDGKAPCRWVAVRHGLSSNGNDHIHVAVSLVREDGTKASDFRDWKRAQAAATVLEKRHGLEVLESREAGRGSRGVKPAETALAARRGEPEPARLALARAVRGCAAAAGDEAEFVRRVRQAGLRIRPRYAAGREDVVVGYSVAAAAPAGQSPVWYGGGHLARDLTLPRLRQEWADSPQHASAAVKEWNAAKRNQRPAESGRETQSPAPELWGEYAREVAQLRDHLRAVPVDDRATWARVARETSGALAAWSARVESTPGPLAAAADSLARSAQLHAHQATAKAAPGPSAKGAAMLLASIAHGGKGTVAQAVLLRQLMNTAKALHDAHQAVGDARRAAEIARAVRTELAAVHASLPQQQASTPVPARAVPRSSAEQEAFDAARLARAGQGDSREAARTPARSPGSPIPNTLTPAREAGAPAVGAGQRPQESESER